MEKVKLEKDIQREICDWLNLGGCFFWRSNNIPVFGRSNDGVKRFRALPKYTPKGIADIICLVNGTFVALEVKRPNYWGKQSPDQEQFEINVKKNGGLYFVVRSLEDVKNIWEKFV